MRGMESQPTHAELFTAVKVICSNALSEVEDGLAKQIEADQVAVKRIAEEKRREEEEAKLAAARDEKARQEKVRQLEQERLEILAVERSLAAKKQALRDAEKANGNDDINNDINDDDDDDDQDDDDDEDNEGSKSAPDDQQVSLISERSMNTSYS
jgi:hypothetical protein